MLRLISNSSSLPAIEHQDLLLSPCPVSIYKVIVGSITLGSHHLYRSKDQNARADTCHSCSSALKLAVVFTPFSLNQLLSRATCLPHFKPYGSTFTTVLATVLSGKLPLENSLRFSILPQFYLILISLLVVVNESILAKVFLWMFHLYRLRMLSYFLPAG